MTLALETGACGEDNFSKDRMSNLRAIGSDFASLIFDLPSSTGLSELVQKCHPVWEALKSRNDLPKLLVSLETRVNTVIRLADWKSMINH